MSEKTFSLNELIRKRDLRAETTLEDIRTDTFDHTIQDWRALVADITLVPQVDESVIRTFATAKQLFVFSLFVYEFATVSLHYAGLALESAIQNRWSLTVSRPAIVQSGSEIETVQRAKVYGDVRRLIHKRNWKKQVFVNGTPFPKTMRAAVEDLRSQHIVTDIEATEINGLLHRWRNVLSHLEFATLWIPEPSELRKISKLANGMYASVEAGRAVGLTGDYPSRLSSKCRVAGASTS